MTTAHPEIAQALSRAEAGIQALKVQTPHVDAMKEAAAAFSGALGILKHCLGLAKLGAFDLPKPAPGPALFLESGAPAPLADLELGQVGLEKPLTEEEIKAFDDLEWEAQEVAFAELLFNVRCRFLSVQNRTIHDWRALHLKYMELNETKAAWVYLSNLLREGATSFDWDFACRECWVWLPKIRREHMGPEANRCWKCRKKAKDAEIQASKAKKAAEKAAAKKVEKATPKAGSKSLAERAGALPKKGGLAERAGKAVAE